MWPRAAAFVLIGGLLGGCRDAPAPPPPKAEAPATDAGAAAATAAPSGQSEAERVAAYSREHPWAENSGASRLSGRLSWDGEDPPAPRWRPQIVLQGVPGTPSAGRYYIVRANEQGDFVFDKIKGGEFMLSDKVSTGVHWRLRVDIAEGEEKTLDLTRDNAVPARDDFPGAGK